MAVITCSPRIEAKQFGCECTFLHHQLHRISLVLQVSTGIEAGYELEYLLLEGHCHESDTGQPPRGLQLLLGRDSNPSSATADTLVMANLVGGHNFLYVIYSWRL